MSFDIIKNTIIHAADYLSNYHSLIEKCISFENIYAPEIFASV